MRKIILILGSLLALLFLNQNSVYSQASCDPNTGSNCFSCFWTPQEGCIGIEGYGPPGNAIGGCEDNYEPDDGVCHEYDNNDSLCNGILGLPCKQITSPPVDCEAAGHFCIGGGCGVGSTVVPNATCPNPNAFCCTQSTCGDGICDPTLGEDEFSCLEDCPPTGGCFVCDPVSYSCNSYPLTSPLCDSSNPDYYTTQQECSDNCGEVEHPRYDCISDTCIETSDPNAPYSTAGECRLDGCESGSGGGEEDNIRCLGGEGIKTAVGCIPYTNTAGFMGFLLKWSVSVGGGIAFLLIVYSSFMILVSAGNPQRIKAGQELLIASLTGLVMLVFSVFILRVIGVDVLQLSQFGQ